MWILIIYVVFIITCVNGTFTCQGGSYTGAMNSCPDKGAQLMSSGGNVTIRVLRATNLPKPNAIGLTMQVSRPFVRFSIGDISASTGIAANDNVNPKWDNAVVNLGFLGSASLITVEILDTNTGLTFANQKIVMSSFRVPFCSQFYGNTSTVDCGEPFNCAAEDSYWEMPTRVMCRESGFINFNPTYPCSNPKSTCLYLQTYIVPFNMMVEKTYPKALLKTPVLTVAGPPSSAKFTSNYGKPFLSSTLVIDSSAQGFQQLKGALMFQTSIADKSYGAADAVKFYAGVNFPSNIFVCRSELDNAVGVPNWLQKEYRSDFLITDQIEITYSGTFACYMRAVDGTRKNRWGGVESGAIPFKTNTLTGKDNNLPSQQVFYTFNYIILAIPVLSAPRGDTVQLIYDAGLFVNLLGSYGLICLWFIYLGFNFVRKINYRVDRISNYISTRVLSGEARHLVAALLLNFNQSPCNVQYRAHLYHATNIISFFLAIPFFLLLSWGFSCAALVRPAALGIGVAFIGISMLFFWFAYKMWEASNWRLSLMSISSFSLSVVFFVMFMLGSLFVDPYVVQLGHNLDFAALSLVFGTINCIPCLILIFRQDRSHQVYMSLVVDKIEEAVKQLKQYVNNEQSTNANASGNGANKEKFKVNRTLYSLLGETYSINPQLPSLKYAAVLQEIANNFNNSLTAIPVKSNPMDPNAVDDSIFATIALSEERKTYFVSLFILFVYMMFAVGATSSPSLAFLNICALILLDTIHLSIAKGNCNWSPGFKILLLVMGRMLICGSPQSLWILNYSTCYVLYAVTLIYEVIDSTLVKLTARKAGEIVFGGGEYQNAIRELLKTMDISGSAEFCLLFLTICFIAILVISAYLPSNDNGDSLSVPNLTVFGMTGWPIYIFGLIAFLVTAIAGLSFATFRAFALESHGLLKGWARETYLFRTDIKLPMVLAGSTELAILLSGLLIYTVTDSAAVLVGCIFLPLIFCCLGMTLRTWMKNDYELIKWPRQSKAEKYAANGMVIAEGVPINEDGKVVSGGGDDLEMAFNMIDNVFGKAKVHPFDGNDVGGDMVMTIDDANSRPETSASESNEKALVGFTLPPLKPTGEKPEKEIKMPPLPLKSVLRRKRQSVGIVNNNSAPLVPDITITNNDIKDNKKDGKKLNIKQSDLPITNTPSLGADDPWAQFEMDIESTEHTQLLRKKKKLSVISAQQQTPWIRRFRQYFFMYIAKPLSTAFKTASQFLRQKVSIHPSKYDPNLDEEEEVDHEEENEKQHLPNPLDAYIDHNLDGDPVLSTKMKKEVETQQAKDTKEQDKPTTIAIPDDPYEEVDVSKLAFWDAFWGGYLNQEEYITMWLWFGSLISIMFFGIAVSLTVSPHYLGFTIWVAWWLAIFVAVPIIRYFQIYTFDQTSWQFFYAAFAIHFLFFVCFIGAFYNGLVVTIGAVWLVNFFFYGPIFAYIIFGALKWVDSGFHLAILDTDGDGKLSMMEILRFLQTFPMIVALVIIFNWQLYMFANYTVGLVFTLGLVISSIAYLYIKDWAKNDYFLSPELNTAAVYLIRLTLFLSFCTAIFQAVNPIFPISVFVFTIAFQYVLKIFARYLMYNKDIIFFFSPYIFPVYSYNSVTQDLLEENDVMKNILALLFCGILWGSLMVIFYIPIHIGVALCCGFFLTLAAFGALCTSYVPRQLAKNNALLTTESIIETANFAKENFHSRRLPLNLEMNSAEYHNDLPVNEEEMQQKLDQKKTVLDRLKERTCLENTLAVMADIRSLKYVREDPNNLKLAVKLAEEQDEYELTWYQQKVIEVKDFMREIWELLPIPKNYGWKRHNQAPFNWLNATGEIFFTGRGPFGLFGLNGYLLHFIKGLKTDPNFSRFYPTWIEKFDEYGNYKDYESLSEPLDYTGILSRLLDMDKSVDHRYYEESRCAIHFLLMLLVSADSKLHREKVLFQKFLRENRFRLASNGIEPPDYIFSSSSYTSVDIPLVAIWLTALSKEEQERFHTLKETFNQEQMQRDEEIDQLDYETSLHAYDLKKSQKERDQIFQSHIQQEASFRKEQRIQAFADSLIGTERNRFELKRELWVNDPNCFVELKENDLYERFRAACMMETNPYDEYAQHVITECETAQRDIRLGEYGRSYQFVDSEFPPSEGSVGNTEALTAVLGWRCSPGICENVELFENGTHPDDITLGVFNDHWLISAVTMVVASGSRERGTINDQIKSLFVPHPSLSDGEMTLETEVGAYCVRINRDHEWIPVIVDDLLPMRRKEHWTNENRGIAGSHCRECKGLWLPMIEKAFAKYYGSYGALEMGYVHHALEELTGCEAESIPLSSYSRGIGKFALWDQLILYMKNGYILGAGTGSSEFVDKEIADMGICFNATYCIYDIRQVDGHRLIKLRNPPGDHEEWKGDWGDKSPLWTKRLRKKFEYADNIHDNIFYMSFDDFLNVFRELYVCKYYQPGKWIDHQHSGFWKKSNEAAIEEMELMNNFLAEQGDGFSKQVDNEANNKKKAKARLDSAGGLPSRFNPGCVLENNPFYSLNVYRPTDVKITVMQVLKPTELAVPFSIFIVKNPHPFVPQRLTELKQDEIVFSTGVPRAEKTLHLYANNMKPGLYVILVAAYMSGMEGNFQMNVLSNFRCDVGAVWPPAWMLREEAKNMSSLSSIGKEKTKAQSSALTAVDNLSKLLKNSVQSLIGGGTDNFDEEEGDEEEDEEGSQEGEEAV